MGESRSIFFVAAGLFLHGLCCATGIHGLKASSMIDVRTKRVYEPPDPRDGSRVLVDGIWPRGMRKEQVPRDLWLKDVAPSTALRKWFAHDRSKWEEFKRRYFQELDSKPQAIEKLLKEAARGPLTLLFSARDAECNQAVALREYLLGRLEESGHRDPGG
jgi:uncharacterized protein YeaO (DUF488 family)